MCNGIGYGRAFGYGYGRAFGGYNNDIYPGRFRHIDIDPGDPIEVNTHGDIRHGIFVCMSVCGNRLEWTDNAGARNSSPLNYTSFRELVPNAPYICNTPPLCE